MSLHKTTNIINIFSARWCFFPSRGEVLILWKMVDQFQLQFPFLAKKNADSFATLGVKGASYCCCYIFMVIYSEIFPPRFTLLWPGIEAAPKSDGSATLLFWVQRAPHIVGLRGAPAAFLWLWAWFVRPHQSKSDKARGGGGG